MNDVLGFSLYEQTRRMFYTATPIIRNGLLNSLIAYWPGDEASGNALDAHINGLDLTDTNTVTNNTGHVYATARQYTAASFEYHTRPGDDALLSCGDNDLTWAAWVYLDSKAAGRAIITKWAAQTEVYINYHLGTDRFSLTVDDGLGTQTPVRANNLGSPSTSTWYLLVAWHDAVANTIYIQINNGLVDSAAHGTGIRDGTDPFHISHNVGSMSGRIGPTAMWKSAPGGGGVLTAAQRTALYNSGAGLPYTSFTT